MTGWDERKAISERKYLDDPNRFEGGPSDFALWAVPRLKPFAGVRELIELGCGPGRDSRHLVVEGFRVHAVDFSPTAVVRATEARSGLRQPFRSRLQVVEGEATRYLRGRPPESADVVYAHLVYATFSPEELTELWSLVHRVLRPGGRHAFAVRDRTDPFVGQGTEVEPGTWRGGPHEVPYHYFVDTDVEALRSVGFERIEQVHPRGSHLLFVLDRKVAPPRPPEPAPSPGG